VATSTHESAGVTSVSPLEVLTTAVDTAAVPMPDRPPKATVIVNVLPLVLVKLSIQRP
jgi:hypothetical protein